MSGWGNSGAQHGVGGRGGGLFDTYGSAWLGGGRGAHSGHGGFRGGGGGGGERPWRGGDGPQGHRYEDPRRDGRIQKNRGRGRGRGGRSRGRARGGAIGGGQGTANESSWGGESVSYDAQLNGVHADGAAPVEEGMYAVDNRHRQRPSDSQASQYETAHDNTGGYLGINLEVRNIHSFVDRVVRTQPQGTRWDVRLLQAVSMEDGAASSDNIKRRSPSPETLPPALEHSSIKHETGVEDSQALLMSGQTAREMEQHIRSQSTQRLRDRIARDRRVNMDIMSVPVLGRGDPGRPAQVLQRQAGRGALPGARNAQPNRGWLGIMGRYRIERAGAGQGQGQQQGQRAIEGSGRGGRSALTETYQSASQRHQRRNARDEEHAQQDGDGDGVSGEEQESADSHADRVSADDANGQGEVGRSHEAVPRPEIGGEDLELDLALGPVQDYAPANELYESDDDEAMLEGSIRQASARPILSGAVNSRRRPKYREGDDGEVEVYFD